MTNPDFPSNSKHTQPVPQEDKKIERVTRGEVIPRKRSIGKQFKEVFIGGDSRSVFQYIVVEVIVPQIKDLITEAASQGLERLIYGDDRAGGRRGSYRPRSTPAPTNYNRYSTKGNNPIGRTERTERSTVSVQKSSIDDILFSTRIEAETVQERMYDLINQYGLVSVSDLHSLIDWSSTHIDQKWGWDDLHGSNIQRVRDGYILNLPKPQPLD